MVDFFSRLVDTTDFSPRWYCGNWSNAHGWLHVLSDLGVWSAYVAIPCVLGYFVVRRRSVPFRSVFWLFVAFILACGTTHLLDAVIFWWPAYRLQGVVKFTTAVVSWATVIALVPIVPRALAMHTPEELEREVAARRDAESGVRQTNAELQARIEALQASEERFRLLVERTSEYAMFVLDPDGRVTSWNPGAERIKQYRAEEILGRHFSCFYPPEAVAQGLPEHHLTAAERDGRFEVEEWRVRKDGSRFQANVLITALRDGAGTLRGFSKITQDITQRKQAEEAIRAANATLEGQVRARTADLRRTVEELSRSNVDLEQFAYVASHDLQEPLRAVAGCVQILKKRYQGQLDDRADELIGHTVEGVTRMQTLIEDLLSYSRIATRGKAFEPVSVKDIVAKALSALGASLAESGASVTQDELPVVPGDAVQLTQLFQNLISNALKFRGPEPLQIRITARREDGQWVFGVADNGIGIRAEYFDRIFVIFQRLHTRAEYPGTGIGLALCKKIVERHGGHISVASVPGRGSSFSFTLPDSRGQP